MLLRSLDVTNAQGSKMSLVLGDNGNGITVKNIDGLDPVEATLTSGNFASLDGEQFYSGKRTKRNITIQLGLTPNFATADVSSLRAQLYAYFMPKTVVNLQFNTFDRFAQTIAGQTLGLQIAGRIESFKAPIFAQDPEVNISIICYDPNFVDPNTVEIDGDTDSYNPFYGDPAGLLVPYVGTVETGVVFTIIPTGEMSHFTINHQDPAGVTQVVDFTYAMSATTSDEAIISSVPGSKYVNLTRQGSLKPILYSLTTQTDWISLLPGVNHFWFDHTGDLVQWKMTYTNKYGGL